MTRRHLAFVNSIELRGQLIPIVVRKSRSKGKYTLIDGLSRLRACKTLKRKVLIWNKTTGHVFSVSTDRIIVPKR